MFIFRNCSKKWAQTTRKCELNKKIKALVVFYCVWLHHPPLAASCCHLWSLTHVLMHEVTEKCHVAVIVTLNSITPQRYLTRWAFWRRKQHHVLFSSSNLHIVFPFVWLVYLSFMGLYFKLKPSSVLKKKQFSNKMNKKQGRNVIKTEKSQYIQSIIPSV